MLTQTTETGIEIESQNMTDSNTITGLETIISSLDAKTQDRFRRIYEISTSTGQLLIPDRLKPKAKRYFAKDGETESQVVEKLSTQMIVRTFNRWTFEGTLFNSLRAKRPFKRARGDEYERLQKHIEEKKATCDFCDPINLTTEDTFGRIRGKHCITGANIAKYDAWSGMIYFDEHDPHNFTLGSFSDYIDIAFAWFATAYETDSRYKNPLLVWNCLEGAGASQVHGHAQLLLGQGAHYAKVEQLRKVIDFYRHVEGREYIEDVIAAHEAVGLGLRVSGTAVLAYMTPTKEKETIILAQKLDDDAKRVIFETLRCHIDTLGVMSFNFSMAMPPLDRQGEFPYMIRIVDRGSIFKPFSDIGSMELYGSIVVSSDPYRVMDALKDTLFAQKLH